MTLALDGPSYHYTGHAYIVSVVLHAGFPGGRKNGCFLHPFSISPSSSTALPIPSTSLHRAMELFSGRAIVRTMPSHGCETIRATTVLDRRRAATISSISTCTAAWTSTAAKLPRSGMLLPCASPGARTVRSPCLPPAPRASVGTVSVPGGGSRSRICARPVSRASSTASEMAILADESVARSALTALSADESTRAPGSSARCAQPRNLRASGGRPGISTPGTTTA